MCGISGFIASSSLSSSVLSGMTEAVRHRGPDGGGMVVFNDQSASGPVHFSDSIIKGDDAAGTIGMGHRRLSIVDTSHAGHQPMSYQDGRYWTTYNGEIFNYIELRDELIQLGHVFLSQSDTEVILAAYAQWGDKCLSRFNGMWAMMIHDTKEDTVFLARDRFGVKPLYYWINKENALYIASEIKQFTVLPGWDAVLNAPRAYDFLVWGKADHTDETLFSGVYHLPPGHCLTLKKSEIQKTLKRDRLPVERWYELPVTHFSGSFADACRQVKNILSDSVRLRLRADVPVGSCLSGGLDSSAIVSLVRDHLAQMQGGEKQQTFSACGDGGATDEKKWIERVVQHTSVEAHYVQPDMNDLFGELDKLIWHQDEPFGSASIYAQWCVFRLAAEKKVKVLLDGQGADEQLAGYHEYFGALLWSFLRRGRFASFMHEVGAIRCVHGRSYGWIAAQIAAASLPSAWQDGLRRRQKRAHHNPHWINRSLWVDHKRKSLANDNGGVSALSRSQILSTHLPLLLHWEDRDSMAHGIESRVPFLDYRLVELTASLPDSYKIGDGITKRVLREAVAGVVQDDIRNRMDKLGFSTPEEKWMRFDAPNTFRTALQSAINHSKGILDHSAKSVLDEVISGERPFSFVVWRMICFGHWMKVFSVKLDHEKAAS